MKCLVYKKWIDIILRIAVAGEFLGHGVFAIQGKEQWIGWMVELLGVTTPTASILLTLVGYADVLVAFVVLFFPIPIVLLWAVFWGFFTALLRPMVGEPIWDFVERWANWGAPLALLLVHGIPQHWWEWFEVEAKPAAVRSRKRG